MMKPFLSEARNILLMTAGALSAGFGLNGFLIPSRFIDGGVTGVSMLVSEVGGYPLALLIAVINLPFILLAFRQLGLRFAARSLLGIAIFSCFLAFVPFPEVTTDKLLSAVFGGFFLGAGIGAAVRGGSVLDGTEIAALLVGRTSGVFRVGDVILLFNIFIFSAAAMLLGVESALYSILTYFSASRTVDFILYGIEEYNGIMIVSENSAKLRKALLKDLKRGVTVLKGEGGKSEAQKEILYCLVTRLEVGKVKATVRELDPGAFVIVHPVADASGGIIKKRPVH